MERKIKTQFSHTVTMDTDWRQDFIDKLQAKLINPNLLMFPESIASGFSYFMEVIPGLMVLLNDFTFHVDIEFTKVPSLGDFCIAYYDISDQISIHEVNNTKHKVGYHSKLGMGIVDASLSSTYAPPISERMYSFRLLISKKILKKFLGNTIPETILEKTFTKKNTIYFYSHIDSNTRVLLLKLKERNFDDASFKFLLKATALQAFGSLIERLGENDFMIGKLSETELQQIMRTQAYLMDQLLEKFPGTDILVRIAGMSASKYIKLFGRIFKCTPRAFFLQEKFLLARELLKSGKFSTIYEVAYELGYSKSDHFSGSYKKRFGILPNKDFIPISFH